MTLLFKLKLPTESAWLALRDTHLVDADRRWLHGIANVVELGVFKHATGRMVEVDGPGGSKMLVPEMVDAPNPGYHVDFTGSDVPPEVHEFCVNPTQPRHVFAGNLVLAMPEDLPEAETTAMVTRGIGQQVPDDVLARLETAVLRGRLTPEMAADRRAWIEAGIAITESRAALSQARQDRERAVEDARKADAERDRIDAERAVAIALRDAEEAKRAAAVVAAQSASGKARTDALAARDTATAARNAATERAAELLAERDGAVMRLTAAAKARDYAAAVLAAERAKIEAARVRRDQLKLRLR